MEGPADAAATEHSPPPRQPRDPQTRHRVAWQDDGGGTAVAESPRVRRFRPQSASTAAATQPAGFRAPSVLSSAGVLSSPARSRGEDLAFALGSPLGSPGHRPTASPGLPATRKVGLGIGVALGISRGPADGQPRSPSKSPAQRQHDAEFHPGRRCCYQIGGNNAEAEHSREQLADLFENVCFNTKDRFQIRLESCEHGRPAVSLRNGLQDRDYSMGSGIDEQTQYETYARALQQSIMKLGSMESRSRGLNVAWMQGLLPFTCYSTLARLLDESMEHGPPRPVLEFCHNEAICMAPAGAKANRRGMRRPRIGSFEVLVAVYRHNEKHWHEFVLFSKLDCQQFPRLSLLENTLGSLLMRAAGLGMRATLAALLLQANVRKKLAQLSFRDLLLMVG